MNSTSNMSLLLLLPMGLGWHWDLLGALVCGVFWVVSLDRVVVL